MWTEISVFVLWIKCVFNSFLREFLDLLFFLKSFFHSFSWIFWGNFFFFFFFWCFGCFFIFLIYFEENFWKNGAATVVVLEST